MVEVCVQIQHTNTPGDVPMTVKMEGVMVWNAPQTAPQNTVRVKPCATTF